MLEVICAFPRQKKRFAFHHQLWGNHMKHPCIPLLCAETLNVLQTVQILLGGRASSVLMSLVTFTYDQLCISPDMIGASIGLCAVTDILHMLH